MRINVIENLIGQGDHTDVLTHTIFHSLQSVREKQFFYLSGLKNNILLLLYTFCNASKIVCLSIILLLCNIALNFQTNSEFFYDIKIHYRVLILQLSGEPDFAVRPIGGQ